MSAEKKALFSRKASGWFKGLAIIMVILSHFAEWWSWFYPLEGNAELVRLGASKLGPYGVAVFLLFSGYGLTKSAGDERIGIRFILKRVTGVYIPYLILVFLIEVLSDSMHSWHDFVDILDGNDFWYMTVLFLFYIAFMVLWLAFKNRHLRAVGMIVFTVIMSNSLYNGGQQDFWYLSNSAFAVGVLLALYEPVLVKIPDAVKYGLTVVFAVVSGIVVRSGLFVEHVWNTPEDRIGCEMWAVFGFTMFIVFWAMSWKWYDPILRFLGKYSLYIYISHTFIFMWIINHVECEKWVGFILAALAILAVSVTLGAVIGLGMKQIDKLVDKMLTQKEKDTV